MYNHMAIRTKRNQITRTIYLIVFADFADWLNYIKKSNELVRILHKFKLHILTLFQTRKGML